MEENASTAVVTQEAPPMSFFERLVGMFFEPTKTLADINRKATWLGIFLVMAVMTMATVFVSTTRIDQEVAIRKAIENSPIPIPEDQRETAIQDALARQRNPVMRYMGLVVAPAVSLIVYLIIAGALLLVYMLMGAPIPFKKSLSATIWGLAPPAVVVTILSIILMYVKDPSSIDLTQGIVTSNLAPLVDSKAHPALASLLGSIDLFSLWSIVLLSIGFAAVSAKKLTAKKAAVGIVVLWVIYVLGKMGFRLIF